MIRVVQAREGRRGGIRDRDYIYPGLWKQAAYLFECIRYNVSHSCNFLPLTNSIHTIHRLIFESRIPLRFHEKNMVGCREIESD